jgi:hypothetical protein
VHERAVARDALEERKGADAALVARSRRDVVGKPSSTVE